MTGIFSFLYFFFKLSILIIGPRTIHEDHQRGRRWYTDCDEEGKWVNGDQGVRYGAGPSCLMGSCSWQADTSKWAAIAGIYIFYQNKHMFSLNIILINNIIYQMLFFYMYYINKLWLMAAPNKRSSVKCQAARLNLFFNRTCILESFLTQLRKKR